MSQRFRNGSRQFAGAVMLAAVLAGAACIANIRPRRWVKICDNIGRPNAQRRSSFPSFQVPATGR